MPDLGGYVYVRSNEADAYFAGKCKVRHADSSPCYPSVQADRTWACNYRKENPMGCEGGACVKVEFAHNLVWVSDTKAPELGPLEFNLEEWGQFIADCKAGKYDFEVDDNG